jgi:hypothetical protein
MFKIEFDDHDRVIVSGGGHPTWSRTITTYDPHTDQLRALEDTLGQLLDRLADTTDVVVTGYTIKIVPCD